MATLVDAETRDPLRTYQFRLKIEPGPREYVAGVRSVSGLGWALSAFETWEGGNNLHRHATPDRVTWEPITLEQGIAVDVALEEWALAARDFAEAADLSWSDAWALKRTVILDMWDPLRRDAAPSDDFTDRRFRRYQIYNAWISKYVAVPALDAQSSEVALLSVELTHEGWRRIDPV